MLVKEKGKGLPGWLNGCIERILGVAVKEPLQYGGDAVHRDRDGGSSDNQPLEGQHAENALLHHEEDDDALKEEPASSLPLQSQGMRHIFHNSPHRAPNHCLVNEYTPGQGIMPHEDGGAYYPVVCTITLGSHGVLDLYPKTPARSDDHNHEDIHDNGNSYIGGGSGQAGDGRDTPRRGFPQYRILYEPRSLLITTEELYTDYLHGIAESTVDTDVGPSSSSSPSSPGASSASSSSGGITGIANWDLLGDQAFWVKNGGKAERGTRVSLTFRDVLKVKEVRFGGIGRGGGMGVRV